MNTLLQNIVKKQAKSYIDCQNFMDMNKLNALIEAFILPEILYFHLVWMFPTNAFHTNKWYLWRGLETLLGRNGHYIIHQKSIQTVAIDLSKGNNGMITEL